MNPTGETLEKIWHQFSTPVGTGWKELIEEAIPFFDILYAWVVGLTTGSSSLIQEKLKFPLDDVIKFFVICMIYVLMTAILDKFWPVMSKSKWLRLCCAIIAAVVNAIFNYDATQIVKYGGSEALAGILNIGGKSLLIISLLTGVVLIFVNKLKAGITLSILVINAGLEISKKTVELAIFYVATVLIVLIIEILTSSLSSESKVFAILYSTLGLIALSIILYIVDKIFSLFNA